jgi:hypothetical protein
MLLLILSSRIHESCPRCGKPLHNEGAASLTASSRRVCMNCRRKVGLCFLCHEPVNGMFVWCPGCGKSSFAIIEERATQVLTACFPQKATEVTWSMHSSGSVGLAVRLCEKFAQRDVVGCQSARFEL